MAEKTPTSAAGGSHGRMHPVLIMLWVIVATLALTHAVPAGKFQREGKLVLPGTYHVLPKVNGLPALLAPTAPTPKEKPARAASVVSMFTAIPAGMVKGANLIFMVMFVGGMFGVMRRTGAIDAGVDRLLNLTSGNVYLLTSLLMVVLALGSTFLGFISEYLVVIPLVGVVGQRLGLPNLFAVAVVGVAAKVGYAASVTNPVALAVAQPLAGVPVFSGAAPRLAIFVVMLAIGIAFVLLYLRKLPKLTHLPDATRLTWRQTGVLLSLVTGGAALLAGTRLWSWSSPELAAVFIALSVLLSVVGGLKAAVAADAFVEGMRSMLLAGLLIGLAGAVEIILQGSQVMDSIIQAVTGVVQGHAPGLVATGLMGSEMVLDVFIPSVSGKAAISMPILTPIAHLSGVSAQVTVIAFLLGGGLMNMVTPTSGMLLAFLSASRVSYGEWIRFIAPLFAVLCVVAAAALFVLVETGL